MTREQFASRFREALSRAATDTSAQVGKQVAIPERVLLLSLPPERRNVTMDEALNELYIDEDQSYVFIDVGIRVGGAEKGLAWIRPSGHHPRPPAEVWDPDGIGPFKSVGGIGNKAEWDEAGGFPGGWPLDRG